MAWRLHEHVLRGEIDNRARGRVTGRIWLAGVAQPLVLNLEGDCHPDLAGCRLAFENPSSVPLPTRPPARQQNGAAGDITAARKVRVFDIPFAEAYAMLKRGEKPPEHTANALYLEWFSQRSGRVVIETTDYRLEVSEPSWRFTAEEIAGKERRAAKQQTPFAIAIDAEGNEEIWDEFRCEQLLRESDLSGEKYGQLLEKYLDHPDRDRIIAHEMGWDHLEEVLPAQEHGESFEPEEETDVIFDEAGTEDDESSPDPACEGIDWVRDGGEGIIHPVAKRARELLDALTDEMKQGSPTENSETVGEFLSQVMILRVKLGAHLRFIAENDRFINAAMLIAWLKRDLGITNQALAAAESLQGHPAFPASRLACLRVELFAIREAVLGIIAELRGEDGS